MDTLDWGSDTVFDDLDLTSPSTENSTDQLPFTTMQMPDPSFTSVFPYDVPLMKQENYNFSTPSVNWQKSGNLFSSWLPSFPVFPTEFPEPNETETQTSSQTNFVISNNNNNNNNLTKNYPIQQAPKKRALEKSMEVTASSIKEIDIVVEIQPPAEVRTRTPSEVRTFSVSCQIVGNFKGVGTIMKISLWYASDDHLPSEPVEKDILGGTKTLSVGSDGRVTFDNLTISESSTKHKEREFFLLFTLLNYNGNEIVRRPTRAFYAYSHKKVLQRRGSVKLRTISKTWGKMSGGESMHVIGSPFIQGPSLSLIVRTPHGELIAKPIEYFSESVLFFELPAYPVTQLNNQESEIKVQILVTNDGRTYSNAIEFVYISDAKALRSRI